MKLFGVPASLLYGAALIPSFFFGQALAQSDAYDLRGVKLGMSLADFRKVEYPDTNRFKNAKSVCTGDSEATRARGGYKLQQYSYEKKLEIIKCSWFSPDAVGTNYSSIVYEIGGIPSGVLYKFVPLAPDKEPQLFEIEATIDNDHFDFLIKAYVEKYGRPATNKTETIQNKAGAFFENRTLSWKNMQSEIEIEQRYEKVTLMRVLYTHNQLTSFVNSMARDILGKPSDKL